MPTSNTPPADSGEPFDVTEFARRTIESIEYGDEIASVLERRVIRLEELTAARWPRSMFLRRKLAREIRASVAVFDDSYIPRGDFYARRLEATTQEASVMASRRHRAWRDRQAEAEQPGEDGPEPGEGLLP